MKNEDMAPRTFRHVSGDLQEARRRSAHIASGEFFVPRIQQSRMGTAGCIAEMGLPCGICRVIVPALGLAFGSGRGIPT